MRLRRPLLLLLALAACDPGHLSDQEKLKFLKCQIDVEKDLFKPKCGLAGCHSATTPQNGLDLVTAGVGTRIKTGTSTCQAKPLITYLAEKLTASPACGTQMP